MGDRIPVLALRLTMDRMAQEVSSMLCLREEAWREEVEKVFAEFNLEAELRSEIHRVLREAISTSVINAVNDAVKYGEGREAIERLVKAAIKKGLMEGADKG